MVARFQQPSNKQAIGQLINSVGSYIALWILMYFSLRISWWLTIPLVFAASAFLIRVFIIFHDCGHGSFFKSRRANDFVGFITGILTFTPYYHWRWEHSIHHSSAGNLDARGIGDIWTMTVREYLSAPRSRRLTYRIARNPLVLFVLAPLFVFAVWQRFPHPEAARREIVSVLSMNVAILCVGAGLSLIFGLKTYLLLQFIILAGSGTAGIWMFYVQHQFDGVYWERDTKWDYTDAALKGSSFYKLPRVLQWFTGNIGFHHVHHLSTRIPNYRLEECHNYVTLFQQVPPITLNSSLKSFRYRLWDEEGRQLVGYRFLRRAQLLPGKPATAVADTTTEPETSHSA